jgi:hypothetical protein
MLVAVPPGVQAELARAFASLMLLKVGHIAGACERMLATWPLVLIVGGRPKESELTVLRATATDISAEVLVLADFPDARTRDAAVAQAVRKASQLR